MSHVSHPGTTAHKQAPAVSIQAESTPNERVLGRPRRTQPEVTAVFLTSAADYDDQAQLDEILNNAQDIH